MTDGNDIEVRVTDLRTGHTQQLHLGQRIGRFAQDIPRSRWLLFAGSVLALSLAFWPWFNATATCRNFGCPPFPLHLAVNPLVETLAAKLAIQGTLFRIVLPLAALMPGLLCSVWVHGHLRSWGQRMGVAVFTLWLLLLAGGSLYSIGWVLSVNFFSNRFVLTDWSPAIGLFFLVLTLGLLWIGLLLAWREILRSQVVPQAAMLQRQTPLAYLGAALATSGGIAWFIGFYGIYWLLPIGCPPTPLFASAPCNNRLSAQRGYEWLVQPVLSHIPQWPLVLEYSYWLLGALIVAGGLALLVALWLRPTAPAHLPWIAGWAACLALLTLASWWGIRQLPSIYPDEQWTNGSLITFMGLLLIAVGVVLRWRDEGAINRASTKTETGSIYPKRDTESKL